MASRFWVGGTGTWDNSDTTHWAATTGGAGGQSVPAAGDTVTLDASSGAGTVTVAATFNASNTLALLIMGAFTGTLDFATNNPNVTITGTFSNNGTGTRTLNLGNGTWTISLASSGTPWDMGVVTNLTFNANSSTILFSATAISGTRTFAGGGKTYNTLTVSAASSWTAAPTFQITGSNTIGTFNVAPPCAVRFTSGTTTTITNAFTWTGTSSTNAIILDGGTTGVATVSSANNGAVAWGSISGMTFSGGGTFTATNSFDMKANTGITITAPSGAVGVIGS